jgi:hypothetical protein
LTRDAGASGKIGSSQGFLIGAQFTAAPFGGGLQLAFAAIVE